MANTIESTSLPSHLLACTECHRSAVVFLAPEIVTRAERKKKIQQVFTVELDKNVWEGSEDEATVGSIHLHELLPALLMWLSSAKPLPLSYPSYCMSLCALRVQIAS